ncbi:high affinity cGMP-specific 3',5'-cyclic phosphodiesterase 9A-like [Thalassophryne amazonica]|uniref:high affinity cGMP-specific 3',5'-cyclic phosphodiesterase 9A-like n=1 Tax=Thalassophryne amazonica TaxID=390379 RepID=UPI001470C729|nr:high affinity cGMP-specific 3',5'-cyclic phosphodiesterase 9A-like [Thalassophryne amazonica]
MSDLFRAAAEAGPCDILKMLTLSGGMLNVSTRLEANSEDSYYRLQAVASEPAAVSMPTELNNLESRLKLLDHKVSKAATQSPNIMCEVKSHVEAAKTKLQHVEHLSWIGLVRDHSHHQMSRFSRKSRPAQQSVQDGQEHVHTQFLSMSSLQLTEEVKEHLKTTIFDNWQWEESEMLLLLQVMYTDLDFLPMLHVELKVLQNFLYQVYRHYSNIPFHNFQHCFCVTQMMYALIWLTDLRNHLDPLDLLIMLTAALCHDLDHPGYNNVYQVNTQTDLALCYNDISPLENHHCAVAFRILSKPECNILKNLNQDQFKHVRAGIIKCILATDMARHNEILNRFRLMQPEFSYTNSEHKEVLMKILVKVSDISNEARPMAVAERWLDRLLQEFFNQSDCEKLKGLPVTPFMDRDKVSKPSSQTGFICFVVLPLFIEVIKLFPCLEKHILKPVQAALHHYSNLERAAEQEEAEAKA